MLVDSEALLVDSEMAFLKQHGLGYTTDYYIANFIGIPIGDRKAKTAALLVDIIGESLPEDFFEPLEAEISVRIEQELQPVIGTHDPLNFLKYPKCVASSSSTHSLESKLTSTGSFELFNPHIYSTELVGFYTTGFSIPIKPPDCLFQKFAYKLLV